MGQNVRRRRTPDPSPMPHTPRSLLDRVSGGNQSPDWDRFVATYRPLLHKWIGPVLLQAADADVRQSSQRLGRVFGVTSERLHQLRQLRSLYSALYDDALDSGPFELLNQLAHTFGGPWDRNVADDKLFANHPDDNRRRGCMDERKGFSKGVDAARHQRMGGSIQLHGTQRCGEPTQQLLGDLRFLRGAHVCCRSR